MEREEGRVRRTEEEQGLPGTQREVLRGLGRNMASEHFL